MGNTDNKYLYKSSEVVDPIFDKLVYVVSECYYLKINLSCDDCPEIAKCQSNWDGASQLSSVGKFKNRQLQKSLKRFTPPLPLK